MWSLEYIDEVTDLCPGFSLYGPTTSTFPVVEGQTYYWVVGVHGGGSSTKSFTLTVEANPPLIRWVGRLPPAAAAGCLAAAIAMWLHAQASFSADTPAMHSLTPHHHPARW